MNDTATTRMLLTTAVLAAVAAFITAPAHAYFADAGGGGSSSATAVPTPTGSGPIPYLSHGIGVDETLFSGQSASASDSGPIPYLSHGIGVDETLFSGQSASASDSGPIPYLSHGIGVDETLFAGQSTRGVDESRVVFDVSSSGSASDWTWAGLGAGMAALLVAGMTALYLTTRPRRGRVALP